MTPEVAKASSCEASVTIAGIPDAADTRVPNSVTIISKQTNARVRIKCAYASRPGPLDLLNGDVERNRYDSADDGIEPGLRHSEGMAVDLCACSVARVVGRASDNDFHGLRLR